MKRCPECRRDYHDDSLMYCLDDGTALLEGPASSDEPATAVLASEAVAREASTRMFAQSASASNNPVSAGPQISGRRVSGKRIPLLAGAMVALAIVLAGAGYAVYRWAANQSKPTPAFQSVQSQRLTTSGKASDAAISPDGKYVAHVKSEAGQESLWLRQVTTTSDTQIVPPSTQNYNGITFSRDSNYIYYRLGESNLPSRTLYQVPTLGGASRKVIENIASPVSLSPDGTRLAFVRVGAARGETALVVANADGTGERQLAVRNEPDRFSLGGPAWSPDGKLVASGVVDFSPTRDTVWYVVEVPVEGGGERAITSENWRTGPVGQVVWLADGTGLALIAFDLTTSSNQIWHISYPDGVARRITSDVNNYTRLSMSTDSRVLAAVQTETAVGVWVAPRANADRARQISSGKYDGQLGVAWMMPDGNILYTSREGGFSDIWIMDQDGKNQKQLTVNAGQNIQPWATSDGRHIVFSSTRPVGRGIWRMDTDGSNLKQLTYGPIGGTPRTSPEGRWMVFSSAQSGSNRIWKISIDGGEPVLLTNKISTNPIVSPDGSLVACWYRDDQPNALNKLAIVPFAGGDPVKVLDVPGSVNINAGVRWMPDGRSLTFVDTVNGVSNIWSIPVDGGTPKQLTDFKTDQIFWFDYSSDGRQLALSRGTQTSDVVLIKDSR